MHHKFINLCGHQLLLWFDSSILIVFFITSNVLAEWVSSEGRYFIDRKTTRDEACNIALEEAKQNALKKIVGENLKSNQLEVCTDNENKSRCTLYQNTFNYIEGGYINEIKNKKEEILQSVPEKECLITIDAFVKEYDEKVEAYEKEKKAWDEGGEESRRGWIAVGRNLAKFSTALWLIFSFIVYGLMPLLRLIPKHFGKDLSITLLPVLMLGVLYSLSRLVVEWIPDSGWPIPSPLELNAQSLWKVMGQFIVHLTHPIANMVITLKEFAVDKWFVPLLFVAATLVIGWRQSILGKVDESSRKKS